MITIEQMVQREVNCCLSHLVSVLSQGYGDRHEAAEMRGLCEQAFELACPIPDYEEAACEKGWRQAEIGTMWTDDEGNWRDTAQELCEIHDVEPYDREVYEFWAVSAWFAEKLIAQGEKVDTDFGGMNVWARTCSGQGIASDGVIKRIYAAMVA